MFEEEFEEGKQQASLVELATLLIETLFAFPVSTMGTQQ